MTGDATRLYCLLEEGDNVNPTSGVGEWPLYTAVLNGHLDTVKLLCQSGGDFNRLHSSTGNSVLHEACARGHYQVAEYLIQRFTRYDRIKMADITFSDSMLNLTNNDGKVPLILAADKGYSKIVDLLLKHGASTSVLDPITGDLYQCQEYHGCQVLIEMHRSKHLKELLDAMDSLWGMGMGRFKKAFRPRYDHNLRDRFGDTLLMLACKQQKAAFIKYILDSAVYMVQQSRRDYIRRSESADSGTFFDLTPPTSGFTASAEHDIVEDLLENPDENHNKQKSKDAVSPGDNTENKEPEVKFTIGGDHDRESAHEATETESAIQSKDSKLSAPPAPPPKHVKKNSPPEEEDPEHTLQENISTLFDSMSNLANGHIYIAENRVSHLCATNNKDGRTCYHRLIEGGDNMGIISAMLSIDNTAINIQNKEGLSPLHLACKLKRKRVVQTLVSSPGVDLNCRTLDGKLPEEMTTDKVVIKMVKQARTDEDYDRLPTQSGVLSFTGSYYDSPESTNNGTSIDFEKINTRFVMMKQQMGVADFYGEFGS